MIHRRFLIPGLLLILSRSVFGQGYLVFQDQIQAIRSNSLFRIGPVWVQASLKLQGLGYDDNIHLQRKEEGPRADYLGTLSSEVSFHIPIGNVIILSFKDTPSYQYFLREKERRTLTNGYSPSWRLLLLKRFVVSGDYHVNNNYRRFSAEFDRLTRDEGRGTTWGLFYETPRKTAIGITGSWNEYFFADINDPDLKLSLSQKLDRKERSGHLEFRYRAFSESNFFLKAGMSEYKFLNSQGAWRNSSSNQAMAGLEFSPFAHINGTLSFGYKNFIPQTKGKPTYSGLIANTSLNLRISRFRFNWNYSRDHSFSFYEDAMYFIENRHETGVSFFLTQFLKINYRYSHGNLDYPQGSFPDLSVQGGSSFRRQDVNQTHTLGIAVRIFKRTGVGISVSFFHWTSNVRGFDIRRNYIGLDLAQQF